MGRSWYSIFSQISLKLYRLGLGRVPGVPRLYRFLLRTVAPQAPLLVEAQGFKLYVDPRDAVIAPHLSAEQVWEASETRLFTSLIGGEMVVVDAGANIGYYTLCAAQLLKGRGQVLSFEPEPKNHALLARNIEVNGCKNVVAFRMALSDRKGTVRLTRDAWNAGAHSMAAGNVEQVRSDIVEVDTTDLDSIMRQLDLPDIPIFIKMDVQGAEALICSGARRTLSRPDVTVLMEFWPDGLRTMGADPLVLLLDLQAYGFQFSLTEPSGGFVVVTNLQEILDRCAAGKPGHQYVNLLLIKHQGSQLRSS